MACQLPKERDNCVREQKTREMARATRSSANTEQASKKRKRSSPPHEKPHKLARTSEQKSSVADSPLAEDDARKILEVLEGSVLFLFYQVCLLEHLRCDVCRSDSLGLLDRVFPLSPSSELSFSLRSLLADPQQHSLRVLTVCLPSPKRYHTFIF